MTDKRFTIENDVEMKDNWNINKRCYHFANGFDAKDCCDMSNELLEEKLECENEIARLELIVNKLKKQREELFIRERDTKNELREFKDENDHLKKEVEEYKEAMKRMMIDMMR